MRKVVSLFRVALLELRYSYRQVLLSCTSLILGVLSVVSVQVVATVAKDTTVRSAEIGRGRQGSAYVQIGSSFDERLKARQLIKNLNGTALLVIDDFGATASAGDNRAIAVRGYSGSLLAVYPYGTSEPLRDGQVLVNAAAAALLHNDAAVHYLGPLDTRSRSLMPSGSMQEGNQPATVFVPERAVGPLNSDTQMTLFYADPSQNPELARARLAFAISAVGLPVSAIETVDVLTSIRPFIETLRSAFLAAAFVTLGVASLGILTLGLARLKGKVAEFALRRTFGATRTDISLLVLLESIAIGLVGSFVALLISTAAYPLILVVTDVDSLPAFPLSAAFAGIAAGVTAGLLGGIVPAVRAGRMTIALVMRA